MSNIAVVLKDEIRRLAKKEIRSNTSSTKGAVTGSRASHGHVRSSLRPWSPCEELGNGRRRSDWN
jgi:hypothetical protein